MIIIEVYVDDILFACDDDKSSQKFVKEIQKEFQMYIIVELTFFLRLKISQLDEAIFIFETKYIKQILKNFKMEGYKHVTIPMIIGCKLSTMDDTKEVDQRLSIND